MGDFDFTIWARMLPIQFDGHDELNSKPFCFWGLYNKTSNHFCCRPLESLCLWNDLWQEKEEIRKWIFVSACVPIWQECFFRKKTKQNSSASLSIRVFHFSAHARTHADFYYLCEVKSFFSVEFLSVDGIRKLAFSCQQRRCSFRES
jgi:hypothetical protein